MKDHPFSPHSVLNASLDEQHAELSLLLLQSAHYGFFADTCYLQANVACDGFLTI